MSRKSRLSAVCLAAAVGLTALAPLNAASQETASAEENTAALPMPAGGSGNADSARRERLADSIAQAASPAASAQESDAGTPAAEAADASAQEAKADQADGASEDAGEQPDEVSQEDEEKQAAAKAAARFDEALTQFKERDFQGAAEAFDALLTEFPASPSAPDAHGYLSLALVETGRNASGLRHAAVDFFKMTKALRQRIAPTFAALAAASLQFQSEALFTAQLADTEQDAAQKQAYLDRLNQLIQSELTDDEVNFLAQTIPPENTVWPIFLFRQVQLKSKAAKPADEKSPAKLAARPAGKVQPRTIGAILPLSGKFGAFGKTVKIALDMALKDSGIRLVTRDTAGNPLAVRQAVRELVQKEGAIVLIGPVLSTEAPFAVLEAEQLGTPLISLTSNEGLPQFGSYIFRTMLTRSAQAKALADYAMGRLGYKNFAVLFPEFAYGSDLAHAFWDEVDSRGGQMRAAESYAIDQTTFRDQARKLVGRYYLEEREEFVKGRKEIDAMKKSDFHKRKLKEDLLKKLPPIIDFDALFIPDSYQRVSLVAPALAVEDIITNACDRKDIERIAETTGKKTKELKTVLLLGSDAWNFQELVDRGGKFVQCAVFVDAFYANAPLAETRAFVKGWTRATQGKMPPLLLGAVSYDTAGILRDIIEQTAPQSRAEMKDALLQVKGFPGACGSTAFDDSGEVNRPLFLLTIGKKGIEQVDAPASK